MGSMTTETDRSGSLKLIATAKKPTSTASWTGECPEGGTGVEFGYTGLVPVREPSRSGGQSDEWLRHDRARADSVVLWGSGAHALPAGYDRGADAPAGLRTSEHPP
jgi:hypothetical protein